MVYFHNDLQNNAHFVNLNRAFHTLKINLKVCLPLTLTDKWTDQLELFAGPTNALAPFH